MQPSASSARKWSDHMQCIAVRLQKQSQYYVSNQLFKKVSGQMFGANDGVNSPNSKEALGCFKINNVWIQQLNHPKNRSSRCRQRLTTRGNVFIVTPPNVARPTNASESVPGVLFWSYLTQAHSQRWFQWFNASWTGQTTVYDIRELLSLKAPGRETTIIAEDKRSTWICEIDIGLGVVVPHVRLQLLHFQFVDRTWASFWEITTVALP